MIGFPQIQVVIPALDEESTIGATVARLRELGLQRIRVIDNGSRDQTAARARAAGAEVITEPRRGYGQACWTGTQQLPAEVEWILFCDADGSDDPADVSRLIEAGADSGADFVLGNRQARPEARRVLTPVQRFGNTLSTVLIWSFWGHRYGDLGPLRLIRRSLYERIAMQDRGFGWTIEMQVRAIELGARIVELPVNYHPRRGGRSKISGTLKGSVQAGTIILSTLGKLAWRQTSKETIAAALLVCLGAIIMVPHGEPQADSVPWFLLGAAVMTSGYVAVWSARVGARIPVGLFWLTAVTARLILLPMAPSDDVWRYLWEGLVQAHGYSPYHLAPQAPELVHLRPSWWAAINHPAESAIYPPLLQLVHRGMYGLFGDAWIAWKLVYIGFDLLTCVVLLRAIGCARALWYAWNPLVIYCIAGGAHFESLLLAALVAAWTQWERGRPAVAAFLLGCSIGVKWITAPLLVWMAWQKRQTPLRSVALLGAGAVATLLPLAWFHVEFGRAGPLWPAHFVEKARGLELIPWIVDTLREPTIVSNHWIPYVFLPLSAAILLGNRRLAGAAEGYLTAVIVCLPSVHPWYFLWLLPWSAINGGWAARCLCVSGFAYFWVWRTVELTGRWETSLWERGMVWLPFLVGLALDGRRLKKAK